ncbi:hypothetical protein KA183_08180, partial [bacterium]|nr:hypothetical protein [bacterium]
SLSCHASNGAKRRTDFIKLTFKEEALCYSLPLCRALSTDIHGQRKVIGPKVIYINDFDA